MHSPPAAHHLTAWFRGFVEMLSSPNRQGASAEEAEFAARPAPYPVVASWNLNWLHALHTSQARAKIEEIKRILRMGCILCLQETHWQPGDAEAVSAATSAHVHHSDCPTSEKAGVAILVDRCSPWRIIKVHQGPDGYAVAVTISKDGHSLIVACIYADPAQPALHFEANSAWIDEERDEVRNFLSITVGRRARKSPLNFGE